MEAVLVKGLEVASFGRVLVVGVFDQLVAGLIDAPVDLIAVIVVLDRGQFEDLAVGLVLLDGVHQTVFVVVVGGLGDKLPVVLRAGDDIADAVSLIGKRHDQGIAMVDLFLLEEMVPVITIATFGERVRGRAFFYPLRDLVSIVVEIASVDEGVPVDAHVDKALQKTIGVVVVQEISVARSVRQLQGAGGILQRQGVFEQVVGAAFYLLNFPEDMVALQVILVRIGRDHDGRGLLSASGKHYRQDSKGQYDKALVHYAVSFKPLAKG